MVNFNKETFLQNIDSNSFDKDINLSSVEETLKRFPAFNSLYLIQAYLLKQKDDYSFEKNIPFIAINVRDRAVLHDIVHKQEKIIEEEELENDFLEEIDITALKTIHSEHEKKSKKPTQKSKVVDDLEEVEKFNEHEQVEETQKNEIVKEIKEAEVTQTIEKVKEIKQVEETEVIEKVKELKEAEKNQEIEKIKEIKEAEVTEVTEKVKEIKKVEKTEVSEIINEIKEVEEIKESEELNQEEKPIAIIKENNDLEKNITKEEKKIAAMNALQEELFGNIISEKDTSEITLKEQKRIEAMKNLQEELFQRKQEKNINKLTTENIDSQLQIEETSNNIEEKNVLVKDDNKKVEEIKIVEEKINKKPATSSIIEDLIKTQEEKVNDIIEEENTFEEKNPKIDFVNWLKLKKATPNKEISKKEVLEPTKKVEEEVLEPTKKEEKEDLIPFDRTSAIEAEMHQEVKASTDPLENFISSEIIRKKKKRNKQKNVIVSETLAEILTLQQKYTEALEVYQLLSLKYPQKSIYFAHQIEKIKTYL